MQIADMATTSYSDLIKIQLLKQRKVLLWGEINDNSAREVIEQLMYLDSLESGKPITLIINSPGGHVHSGFTMYDLIHGLESPVHMQCTGMAASMASILLSAGTKGKRLIHAHARVMIHQPSGGIGGPYADISIQADELIKAKELSAELLGINCGKTKDEILNDFDRDYWMNAEEAIRYGLVDQLV